MRRLLVTLGLLSALVGCEQNKAAEPVAVSPSVTSAPIPGASAAVAAPGAIPGAVPATATAGDTIPVAADFEDEAEKSITKANYRAELDSLEAEIK